MSIHTARVLNPFPLLAALFFLAVGSPTPYTWAQQTSTKVKAQKNIQPSEPQEENDDQDEDLAPAAVALDVSHDSPLIRLLYQATRENKEQPILDRLAEAKTLIASGADVKATDAKGRTALHWAVFGSSYSTRPKVIVAYEAIADALLERGVELNREDAFNNTAFDYLLYSPNFEMQTLLLEHGANSGFLSSRFSGQPQSSTATADVKADLSPGQTLSVRLNTPVYSDRSRTGDPVEGTVTYPLCKNGEQVACNDGELLVAPGTRVEGTVLFAQKAPDKYSLPRLVLDFSAVLHQNGERSLLYARVLNVDDAREEVRNNEILGIVQPHASGKVSLALAALSASNPIAGYTIKGVQTVYGLSIRREILFPAGTDLQVQIVRPSQLQQKGPWAGWQQLPQDKKLQTLVAAAPLRVHTRDGKPSDLTNLMFLGTEQQLLAAFQEAGWFETDGLNAGSALKTVQATIRKTGYSSAPVSSLLINGRLPDMVMQKSLDTFAKRHHIRIWKQAATYDGREIWVGAATHDIAVSKARGGTKWSHRIDPHIDRERDWISTDLLFAGTAVAYADVDRPTAPKKAANATGDEVLTDGKMSVLDLGPAKTGKQASVALKQRP